MSTIKQAWTVSIIAQYLDDDPLVVEAYKELEWAICSQKQNVNIKYIIFFYDQRKGIAKIKIPDYTAPQTVFVQLGADIPIPNFYDGTALTEFFVEHVKTPLSNNHGQIVMTWGHGAGFGLFPSFEKLSSLFAHANLELDAGHKQLYGKMKSLLFLQAHLPINDSSLQIDKLQNGFSDLITLPHNDFLLHYIAPRGSVLKLQVFREVLKKGIGQVDILITMNCYMQLFETGYYLKDVVDTMISPQTTIPFWGFNYEEFARLLNNNTVLTVEAICENVCIYFRQKYYNDYMQAIIKQNHLKVLMPDEVAFSANKLSAYENVRLLLQKIFESLNKNWETDFYLFFSRSAKLSKIIDHARKKCFELASSDFVQGVIDIKTFFDNVGIEISPTDFEDNFESLFSQFAKARLQAAFIAHQPGRLLEPIIFRNRLQSLGTQGISMIFPSPTEDEIDLLRDLRINHGFGTIIDMPAWNEFLDKYLNIVSS
jgi:hypothetical protein